jgi:5'-deoxynucleotidase YfbR-like HD superfamily hydrolase
MKDEDCKIVTYTGRQVNPLALRVEDIDIKDIAHSLACSNRFIGHTAQPISIAQHSIYVALLVHDRLTLSREYTLQALLHDASEAYLGDITKWLKMTDCMDGYRQAEFEAQGTIYLAFDVPLVDSKELYDADQFMVRFEAMRSWPTYPLDVQGYEEPTTEELTQFAAATRSLDRWYPWSWQESEARFLEMFMRLYSPAR